ncbi:uncharacterized protein METZ01_LOCUS356045, partial [marine metagenome]
VGKNMVFSMRHWSTSTGVLDLIGNQRNKNNFRISDLGHFLFGKMGCDPYLENPNTLWLLHWLLASKPKRTLFYWLFNLYNQPSFNKDKLINDINNLIANHEEWKQVSVNTIGRDIDCLINTYTSKTLKKKLSHEDTIECPFAELGLITAQKQGEYLLKRDSRNSLGDGIFLYALVEFWKNYYSSAQTMTFEKVLHAEGSPGKIFCLDESDLDNRILRLEDISKGDLEWSQSAGMGQIIAKKEINLLDSFDCIKRAYR